jgi:hypothetical protein
MISSREHFVCLKSFINIMSLTSGLKVYDKSLTNVLQPFQDYKNISFTLISYKLNYFSSNIKKMDGTILCAYVCVGDFDAVPVVLMCPALGETPV